MDLDDILVEEEIREEEEAIKDIRDFAAVEKSSKTLSALNHCDYFLKGYCTKEKMPYYCLRDIGYEGIDGKGNMFWDKMVASFLYYLGAKRVVLPEMRGWRIRRRRSTRRLLSNML